MVKESRTYSTNGKGDSVCFIRITGDDWSLITEGVGKDRAESFKRALIRLVELTTYNVDKIEQIVRHK